jgi:putative tryptophan/tyrosine transport system substrate-binding protein
MVHMGRREVITLLGGAAAAWPLAARAQQAAMPVIGFLRSTSLADSTHIVTAFRQGLKEAGFVEGQNIAIEYRWAENHPDRLPALAAELIGRQVTLLVGNQPAALAAKAATTTVPIVVVTGYDPVRDGLVSSLNRPGGNVTGVIFFSTTLGPKRLQLLRELAPKATTIAVLVGPDAEAERIDLQAAAQTIGQQLLVLEVSSERDIETAIATFVQRGAEALVVAAGPFVTSQRERLVALAASHRLPAIYGLREFATAGGLMSYASSFAEAYRQAGIYAGRILMGANPADLPMIQSTKFDLVINLKTAKALGLTVPPTLLAIADEVIE